MRWGVSEYMNCHGLRANCACNRSQSRHFYRPQGASGGRCRTGVCRARARIRMARPEPAVHPRGRATMRFAHGRSVDVLVFAAAGGGPEDRDALTRAQGACFELRKLGDRHPLAEIGWQLQRHRLAHLRKVRVNGISNGRGRFAAQDSLQHGVLSLRSTRDARFKFRRSARGAQPT